MRPNTRSASWCPAHAKRIARSNNFTDVPDQIRQLNLAGKEQSAAHHQAHRPPGRRLERHLSLTVSTPSGEGMLSHTVSTPFGRENAVTDSFDPHGKMRGAGA